MRKRRAGRTGPPGKDPGRKSLRGNRRRNGRNMGGRSGRSRAKVGQNRGTRAKKRSPSTTRSLRSSERSRKRGGPSEGSRYPEFAEQRERCFLCCQGLGGRCPFGIFFIIVFFDVDVLLTGEDTPISTQSCRSWSLGCSSQSLTVLFHG